MNMSQLPESILYKLRCFFALGVVFMTPLLTMILNILLLDYKIKGIVNLIVFIVSIALFAVGFWFMKKIYRYILNKEREYGID